MKTDKNHTTKVKVDLFKVTKPLLESMYMEFKELSKKKPDASISKNKIKSDVTLILSQYVASVGSFESKYQVFNGIKYTWNIK